MKDSIYFSHDSNARNDIKIKAMRKEHGVIGYAAFWIIVEMLRESEGYMLPLKIFTFMAINDEVDIDTFDAESFINDCITKYELFNADGSNFWSESLLRRMKKKDEIVKKRKEAAKTRWNKQNKYNSNANAVQQNNTSITNAMQTDAKKESKESKESKVINKRKESSSSNTENDASEDTTTMTSPSVVLKFYEKNIGPINSIILEKLLDWSTTLGDELVKCGIEQAVLHAGYSYAYLESILQSYLNKGYKTRDQVLIDEAKRKQQSAKRQSDDVDVMAAIQEVKDNE